MEKPTKDKVLTFIDFLIAKGLMNSNSGGAWKSAVGRILEDYAPDADLSDVDVPSEIVRYNNRHPNKLSPDSLQTYQRRVQQVLSEFAKYQASPTTYKGAASRPITSNGKAEKRRPQPGDVVIEVPPGQIGVQGHAPTARVTDTSLAMPFPLRQNFLAQLVIPRDMTKDEANRLCAFIQALAQDKFEVV